MKVISEILKVAGENSDEIVQAVGYKLGTASLVTNIGLAATLKAGVIVMVDTWTLGDTAIVISMCVSVMFGFKLHMDWKLAKLRHENELKEKNK
jgi:uncharacterized membrane protein